MAGSGGGRPSDPPGQVGGGVICQPPLVHHSKIPPKTSGVPPGPCFDGRPLLGFSHMVAPINKNEGTRDPLPQNQPLPGDVLKLLGGKNATPSVAPPLPDLLRQILEGKQIQNKTIDDFLARNESLKRYSSSFRLLWTILENRGFPPPRPTTIKLQMALCSFLNFPRHKPGMPTVPFCFSQGWEGGSGFTPF